MVVGLGQELKMNDATLKMAGIDTTRLKNQQT